MIMKKADVLAKVADYQQDYKIKVDEIDVAQFNELRALINKMHDLFGATNTANMLQSNRKNIYNIRHSEFLKLKIGNYRKLRSLAILTITNAEFHTGLNLTSKRKIELAKGKGLTLSVLEILESTSLETQSLEKQLKEIEEDEYEMP